MVLVAPGIVVMALLMLHLLYMALHQLILPVLSNQSNNCSFISLYIEAMESMERMKWMLMHTHLYLNFPPIL